MPGQYRGVALNNKGGNIAKIGDLGLLNLAVQNLDAHSICLAYLKRSTNEHVMGNADVKYTAEPAYDTDSLKNTPIAPGSVVLTSTGVPTLIDRDQDGILYLDRVPNVPVVSKVNGSTSIPATKTLTSAGTNFTTLGVVAGDKLVISDGYDKGEYTIVTVGTTTLVFAEDFPVGSQTTVSFTVHPIDPVCGSVNYFTGGLRLDYPSSPSAAAPAKHGTVLGTVAPTFNLAPGDTLAASVDAGPFTATWDAARAILAADNGGTFAASAAETLVIAVDSGANQTITFGAGTEASVAQYIALINAQLIGAFASPNLESLVAMCTLLNEMKADYNAHRVDVASHPNADVTNIVTAPAADAQVTAEDLANDIQLQMNAHFLMVNTMDEAIVLLNDIQTQYDAHIIEVGAGEHINADVAHGSAVPVASDYASSVILANALRTQYLLHAADVSELEECITLLNDAVTIYEAHRIQTVGPVHAAADGANVVNVALYPCTDYASACLLADELALQYEAHRQYLVGGCHAGADAVNAITAPAAATMATLIGLCNDIRTQYEAHRVVTPAVHAGADAGNVITAVAVGTAAVHIIDDITHVTLPAVASNMPTLIALTNALSAEYTAHNADVTVHGAASAHLVTAVDVNTTAVHWIDDVTHTSVAPIATNYATLVTLCIELLANYNAHLGDATCHPAVDVTNTTTTTMDSISITSDRYGKTSKIEVVSGSGTILAKTGLSAASATGVVGSDVNNIDAVTFAEIKAIIEADVTDSLVTLDETGFVRLTSNTVTVGAASIIQCTGGNVRTILGFDALAHLGSDAGAYVPVLAEYIKTTLIPAYNSVLLQVCSHEDMIIKGAASGGSSKVLIEV